jgi:hypothetical protein
MPPTPHAPKPPDKVCPVCARPFSWRKKWAACWNQVKYCSDRCRNRRISPLDARLEQAILDLLHHRPGSICPSEPARLLQPGNWRALMEPARAAGRRLAERNLILITQAGRAVDPGSARGPIRFARGPAFPST